MCKISLTAEFRFIVCVCTHNANDIQPNSIKLASCVTSNLFMHCLLDAFIQYYQEVLLWQRDARVALQDVIYCG